MLLVRWPTEVHEDYGHTKVPFSVAALASLGSTGFPEMCKFNSQKKKKKGILKLCNLIFCQLDSMASTVQRNTVPVLAENHY